ncbi:metal-sensitive transcriptional regulator [Polycladomyces sp. WAk]|uniref:Metal-sensitive transcriptional regulator n=1 Tax=Polycladomyces zharkentensis TaxID=2807616 RepID=A0ABS2WFR6_9BACL|nr:metal-sensitive transcriptional regulator [Polycladomyces sp. WAk]MBN2908392.1 metal-sensitive transcriptional regulator [Polycladomyces sp. WAk]
MEYTTEMRNRLKRIEGQVRGVLRMMEEDVPCKDVVAQLSAVRSAVDRAIAVIVSSNMERCIREELEKGDEAGAKKVVKEAIQLLVKSR